MKKRINMPFWVFNTLISLWCVFVYNLPFLRMFSETNAAMWVKCILPVFLFFVFESFHCLFVYKNKWYKIVLCLLFLANGFASYFIGRYNVPLSRTILINLFETNVQEAGEFFDFNLFCYLTWTSILPMIFICLANVDYKAKKSEIKQRLIVIITTLCLIGVTALPFKKDISLFIKANFNLRYMIVPTSYLVNVPKVVQMKYFSSVEYIKVNKDVKKDAYWKDNGKKNLFVFVLGESARNANFSLTGYERDTSLPLREFQNELYVFQKMESCATLTRYSLPCLFTHFEKKGYDADTAGYTDNALDIMDTNGYKVKWFDNELGCNKMCRNVETKFTCEHRDCFDVGLNEALYADLKNITQNTFYVLHQRGSHGVSYYKRYPDEFKKYSPICTDTNVKKCTYQELLNTYDNTIYYTNYLLADLIKNLKAVEDKYNVVILYTSDHGESLGEDGVYFHGGTVKEQTEVPFFFYIGDKTANDLNLDKQCLKEQANQVVSHDNLFHTFLGLAGLSVEVYKPELDLISRCKIKN